MKRLPFIAVCFFVVALAAVARGAVLSEAPVWRFDGDQNGEYLGYALAGAGDVNGDGFADVVVGSRFYAIVQYQEGRAWVFHGTPTGLSPTPDWTVGGDQYECNFGRTVARAGDVNNDGYDDMLVAAHYYDAPDSNEGRVYLYLGSATGLSTQPAWTTESNQAMAFMGWSLAGAGDVNGDGYDDVIISAVWYDNQFANEGRAWVFHGTPTGLSAQPAWTADGGQAEAAFGFSVASAGDVNHDGYADVIVGAYLHDNGETDEGRASLYLGSPTGLAATPAWTAEGNQTGAYFGYCVAGVGDVNGDGFDDVAVGAHYYDDALSDEGRVFVYYGSASGLGAAPDWTAWGGQTGANLGNWVGRAGDVNGDGFADIVAGQDMHDGVFVDEGRAVVFLGSATGSSAAPDWTASGGQTGAQFGWIAAGAGDVDGDGRAEIAVAAPLFDGLQNNQGAVFLFRGGGERPASARNWTLYDAGTPPGSP